MHQFRLRERLAHGNQARPWQLYNLSSVQGAVFPCHWHPEWELLVVDRGTMELTRNQTVERLGPGDAAFLTGTDLHGGTGGSPDLSVAALVFQPGILRSERQDAATERWIQPLEAGTLKLAGVLSAGSQPAALASQLVEVVRRDNPGMELAVKGLLFQFLSEAVSEGLVQRCVEPSSADPLPRIRSSLQFIEEQFAEPLTAETLAALAHLSPSHFTRLFKAVTGDTPIRHLIRRRVDEAALLLREGDLSVTEAAVRVGFTNFSHFSQTFRAYHSLSPSEFKKNRSRGSGD